MKIAVFGAGAVGCYFGALLARAGHDVVLVGRTRHVEAIAARGLRLQTRDLDTHVALHASTDAAAVRGAALVLCCVKSADSEAAARALAPHLDATAIVMSMQNGVDNAARLQALLAQPVVATAVYVAAQMAGPGHVRHHGRGELVVAPSPGDAAIVAAFGAAGVPVTVSAGIDAALWTKLAINCAYNALSAITQRPYGPLFQDPEVRALMQAVVDECGAVARAEGVALPDTTWAAVEHIAATMPTQVSSTAHDLARGRRTEIDHLNGIIVRRGRERGVPAPANHALYALVRQLESPPIAAPAGDAPGGAADHTGAA